MTTTQANQLQAIYNNLGNISNNMFNIRSSIEFTKFDDYTVSATVDIGINTIPSTILLVGQYPLGVYNGLRFYYIKIGGEPILNFYMYAEDNVNYASVTTNFSISGTRLTIKITSNPLGQYRLYGYYNLYFVK